LSEDIHAIWDGVKAGDADAWRRLVRMYAGLVHGVALRAGLSTADAEDCAQHTWLSLYRRRRAIVDPVALPAWLIRTAHRQAVALSRRRGHQTTDLLVDSTEDGAALPDAQLEAKELEAHLEAALRLLRPRCRQLLTSLYLTGKSKSYRDLARDLKVRPNSLGPLRSRCLKQLADILKKKGYSKN